MGREAFVDESCISEAIRLVFEEDLEVAPQPIVLPAPNLGGNMVTFRTARGHVTLLDKSGLLLSGMFTDVQPSEATPSVSLDVAAANAQRVIDRIFPWASAMPWTGKSNDHGSAGVDYDISWRDTVDGVELPSWASSTTTSHGEVMTFNGHYYPIISPPRIVLDQDRALAIALATMPPLTRLKSAKLQMRVRQDKVETYWSLYMWTDSPPGFTGYRLPPGSIVLVDATAGDLLPL
jgi:hypothetical protein